MKETTLVSYKSSVLILYFTYFTVLSVSKVYNSSAETNSPKVFIVFTGFYRLSGNTSINITLKILLRVTF